jgi:hypothetical protein
MSRAQRKHQSKIPDFLRGRPVRGTGARAKSAKVSERVPDEQTFDAMFADNAEVVDHFFDQYAPRI